MEPLDPGDPLARLSTWMPGEAPPEGHRAALLRLAAALRDITEALMDMDAPEADLIEAAEASERFVERLLKARGVDDIHKVRVDLDPGQRASMMERTGRRTVPQIYIGAFHVGGFDDLSDLDRAGRLVPLLSGNTAAT